MKHAKVKRLPYSLIALVMAMVLLVAAIPFTAVAGDTVDYYTTVTEPNLLEVNGTDGGKLTDLEEVTDLVPTIPSKYVTAKLGTTEAKKQIRIKLGTNCTFGTGQAILFYFEGGNMDNGLLFRWGPNNSANNKPKADEPYYVLDVNAETKEWETGTLPSDGYMPVATNFKGWFLIPYSSFTVSDTVNLTDFWTRLYFSKVAADYAFAFGAPMVVSTDAPTFTKVMLSGETEARSLVGTPALEPGEKPIDAYTANMHQVVQVVGEDCNETTDGAKEYELVDGTTTGAPNIPGKFAKFTVANSKWMRLLIPNGKHFTFTDMSMMMYVKSMSGSDTKVMIAPMANDNAAQADTYYYLLSNTKGAQWEKKTVAAKNYVILPAGFEGWVRIPHSSFGSSLVDQEFTHVRLYFQSGAVDTTLYVGAVTFVEDAASYEFAVNGAPAVPLFPSKTIRTPDGVTTNIDTFYGFETMSLSDNSLNQALKVTVDDVSKFVGCTLYYQYTNDKGKEVKVALLRAGSKYHGTAAAYDNGENNTQFYIPELKGAKDGKIVADTATNSLSDNAAVTGISAVYYDDGNGEPTHIDNDGYYRFRITARASRQVVHEGVSYDLKYVKLFVAQADNSTISKTYDISTLSDRCGKYAEFVKTLRGTNQEQTYNIKVIGIYKAEGKEDLSVESAVLTGQNIETIVENDDIVNVK